MNKFMLKHEEVKDGQGDGGAPNDSTPEQKDIAEAKEGGGEFDDFGYPIEKPKADESGKKDDKPAEKAAEKAVKKEDEKPEGPVAGYGDKPLDAPKDEEAPVKPAEKIDLGYELDLKGLGDADSKVVSEFAKKNGLTKEAAQALVDLRKQEYDEVTTAQEAAKKQRDKAIAKTKSDWDSELRNDPKFGGQNFDHNRKRVDKVLTDFFPETKKVLTEKGTMLPPYVMRDYAKLADHLYGTESLVQGEGSSGSKKTDTKVDDPLAFYE